MAIFTSDQLNNYTLQAEQDFCDEYRCIIDRLALDIVIGTDLYVLPDNVIDIRRITYRGDKVYPISHRDMREYFQGNSPQSRPLNYIYNNVGQLTIKLFPAPAETIIAANEDLLLPTVIANQCIVEFYTAPNGIGYRLPEYLRRRLLKTYVLKQAFLSEGKGQNLKASVYWEKKWNMLKKMYGEQLNDQLNTPRRLISGGYHERQVLLPPILPYSKRGIGVDPGE